MISIKQWVSFKGRFKVLHLSWVAFFLSFFVWFNFAPLATTIKAALGLNDAQIKTLFICNIVLTIPARIIIGMLVDRFGPRKTFTTLLVIMSVPCFLFAMAQTFEQMVILRLILGFVGAGFVIGIRMIGEWFGPKEVGFAEGIYGGWGNFGSSAAAFLLPLLAIFLGVEFGWRIAIGFTGVLCVIYAPIYYKTVRDTPSGKTYFSPKKVTAMEVSSYSGLASLILMSVPIIICLGVLVWKLQLPEINFISSNTAYFLYAGLCLLLFYQVSQILKVNWKRLKAGVQEADKFEFRQVSILNVAYAASFGAELAIVSMLPSFFETTFNLNIVAAGMIAATFPFINLIARPMGGIFSDKFGRKLTLSVLFFSMTICIMGMSAISSNWFLPAAILMTMGCSFFVKAANGAIFSIVPLIKRRITGQIAGMVGAYGNVGAVCFLTIYSMVEKSSTFFYCIAAFSTFSFFCSLAMKNPKGAIMEIQPDGSVEMLEVA